MLKILPPFLLMGAFFLQITTTTASNLLEDGTEDQLKDLAETICLELFYGNKTARMVCKSNFLDPLSDGLETVKKPPEVRVRCRSKTTLTVSVTPSSEYIQLVIHVPENPMKLINTRLFLPNESIAEINAPDPGRIWSTTLNGDGSPVQWLAGEVIPKYTKPDLKLYNIDFERDFQLQEVAGGLVNVSFKWNSSDDSDSCFSIKHVCNRSENIIHGKTKPDDNNIFVLSALKMDDICSITVEGKYGATTKEYKTPSCEDYTKIHYGICPPDYPQIRISSSRAASGVGWDVTVGWQIQKHPLLGYNVTLMPNINTTLIQTLSGDSTEVTFPEVIGDRTITAKVTAIGKYSTKHSVREGFLTPKDVKEEPISVVMASGWAGLLVTGIAAVMMFLWVQRRKRTRDRINCFKDMEYGGIGKESSCSTFSTDVYLAEEHWELRPERLVLHEVIGEGAFGVVRRALLAPAHKEVAVKMLKEFPSVEEIRSFRSEMEVMKSVGAHPHVVSLLGCFSGQRPFIVAEYCSKGNLLNYLRCAWDIMSLKRTAKYYNNNIEYGTDYRDDPFQSKNDLEHSKFVVNKLYDLQKLCDMELTAVDLLSFCRQIAMGMEFLASNRVVHRDLAARNILVTCDKTLKIADFGLSRDVYQENQYKQKGMGKLPIKWMALESLTQRIYTTHSDVWSFGVVLWEVVTVGGSPYPGVPASRLPRLLRAGYRMPRPSNCSKQLYDIMLSCWSGRPRERPTFGDLHRSLDGLLNSACAAEYLSLELEEEDAPQPPTISKYFALLPRKNRYRYSKESYERPLKSTPSNHYTTPPASLPRTQLL